MITSIIDKQTGQIAKIPNDMKNFPSWEYAWQEGNYSCDCNRAILFGLESGCGNTRFALLDENGENCDLQN